MENPAELPSCPEFIKKQIPAFKREKNLLVMRFLSLMALGTEYRTSRRDANLDMQ